MPKPTRLPDEANNDCCTRCACTWRNAANCPACSRLLDQHHYLGSLKPVGERLYYVATDASGRWLAILVFSAAANHLRGARSMDPLDQRTTAAPTEPDHQQLPFSAAARLFGAQSGVRILRLTLDRLSADWQARYGHPILVVETFVDPDQFQGTVYTASGWVELGETDGWGRQRRDYYVKHDKPKRLFVRALEREACRSLQAEHLKPALAVVEAKVPVRCTKRVKEIESIVQHFKRLPEYRERVESYPLFSLAALILLAMLCEAPRGQTDLEKFARGMSQGQRRALGIRRNVHGKYPAPSQSTFSRFLAGVDEAQLEATLQAIQQQVRGPAPKNELVTLDGKEPKHGSGASILTAVSVPSQYYLGSAVVDVKTNEIPVAQETVIPPLDLEGRFVSLDALHTQDETARRVVLDAGGDYLLTVKKNQPTLLANIQKKVTAPQAGFPPYAADTHASPHPGAQQGT